MQNKPIGHIQRKSGDSQFWAGLMKIKEYFLGFCTFDLNNRENTRFWEDKWIGNSPLKQQYPSLYRIARHKQSSVASVFSMAPLNISFRISLLEDSLACWHNLVARIIHVRFNERSDVFRWGLNQNGILILRTMHIAMITGNVWQNRLL
jgi:hypothetical protein